jgi:hypothetical protein
MPILSREQETNPWISAEARIDNAAAKLGLDDGIVKVLKSPTREVTVNIPVQHGATPAPAIGGGRYGSVDGVAGTRAVASAFMRPSTD